jgi:hypothetical protein
MNVNPLTRRQSTASLLLWLWAAALLKPPSIFLVDAFSPARGVAARPRKQWSVRPPTKVTHGAASSAATTTSSTTATATSLPMAAHPGVAVAAITGAITGGFAAGSLHAIAGTSCLCMRRKTHGCDNLLFEIDGRMCGF